MAQLDPMEFKRPGTVEFVLAEAGLVTLTRIDETNTLRPTEALNKMFGGTVQDLDKVLPLLMEVVKGMSYDRSGLGLNGKTLKTHALVELRHMGMTNEALASIESTLAEGGAKAQQKLSTARQLPS